MDKNIIVAGGGHGGIAAAKLLAEKGFNVTVYEKNKRRDMGYDWTDIFDPKALDAVGIPMPDEDKFNYKHDMTFYSTSGNTAIKQQVPKEELEIQMERKDIYNMLISAAREQGVKFVYGKTITAPVMCGDRVVGIEADGKKIYADLVIDACGCNSPIRSKLPKSCLIEHRAKKFEKFYVYRAFYNRVEGAEVKDEYKVTLLPEGKTGIGWVAAEEDRSDLLIGRFEPFDLEEANRTADAFRKENPVLGTELKRGGEFVQIPVRQPLAVMVADGYAAIGDSAFMTVPIIGSGIANSLKAAKLLADAVAADKEQVFCAETLWKYQLDYFKQIGSGLAPLAAVKLLLTKITPEELDYIFDNGILTWREMTITADSTTLSGMLHFSSDLPGRAVSIVKNKELLKKLLGVGSDIAKVISCVAAMPKHYSKFAVARWARAYNKIYR